MIEIEDNEFTVMSINTIVQKETLENKIKKNYYISEVEIIYDYNLKQHFVLMNQNRYTLEEILKELLGRDNVTKPLLGERMIKIEVIYTENWPMPRLNDFESPFYDENI